MNGRAEIIEEAIAGRRSVRAFTPDPVQREVVARILDVAARAPSGTNMQPWRVYVLAGAAKNALSKALVQEHAGAASDFSSAEYRYYPPQFFEPYLSRRRKVGFDLYGLLDIQRGDTDGMRRQHGRNFVFFGAPVGLIFTMDRRLEIGSWLDYGMFLQNVMTAARAHGLETCAQAAFAPFHQTVRRYVPIPDSEILLCGMSLGYEDQAAPENRLRTERSPAAEFAQFLGWEDGSG